MMVFVVHELKKVLKLPATTTKMFRVEEWTLWSALPLMNSEFETPKKLNVMLHMITERTRNVVFELGPLTLKNLKWSIYVSTETSTIPPTLKCWRKNGTSRT